MAKIFCSHKLNKFIGKEVRKDLDLDYEPNKLGDWNGNLFYYGGRKCLVFVHNLTLFTLFFTDILKKDLKNFPAFFRERLERQLLYEWLLLADDSTFVDEMCKEVTLFTTNNDKINIGYMNDFTADYELTCNLRYRSIRDIDTPEINRLINKGPMHDKSNSGYKLMFANKMMKELITNHKT